MLGKRPLIASQRGMVTAAHPQAAMTGAIVLDQGGNAFDAAVTVAATLNVVEPFMSGLAGQGMATVWVEEEQRVRCLDFVTRVPVHFDATDLIKEDIFKGAKAIGPPGNLAAWATLAQTYGSQSFADLLAPAIRLARDGMVVTEGLPVLAADWIELRSQDAEWKRVYTGNTGTFDSMRPGMVFVQPDLADTLSAIATHGINYLYDGPLGARMVEHLEAQGGFLTMDDLRSVAPQWVSPISTPFAGLSVHTLPPPAESFQFLLTLALLEHEPIQTQEAGSADHLDHVMRAIRIAAEARIQHNQSTPAQVAQLLAADSITQLAQQLNTEQGTSGRTHQWQAITDPSLAGQREYTTSFSVADAQGNMVCVTQSLGSIFGSGVVIPDTGVCMNNFLNWGELSEESPNVLTPGGQLAMCLAPTIATSASENKPVLALGTPGSYGILQTQAQAMVYLQHFGLPLQDAIEAPRVRLWDGTRSHIEGRIDPTVVETLNQRGHQCVATDLWTAKVGGMQAIQRNLETGVMVGAADPRRDGYAIGI